MAENDDAGTLTHCPSSVCSSSFKMKPVQITYPAASATHHQPRQYRECDGECNHGKCNSYPTLPAEMCLSILSFLEPHDLIYLSTINHLWNSCCKDESLWKTLFVQNPDAQVYAKIKNSNWYDAGVWMLQCLGTEFDDSARKKDGKGRYTFINGESYFGEWKESKFNGFVGVCSWPDGRRYTGMFREGKRFGYGIFTWPSGCKYEGEWEDDRRHGKGKDTWPDSSSFCGEYKHDKFDGFGHFQWEDGGQYEGHWKEDHRHGFGVHKWKDGRVFKGEFAHDRFLGDAKEE